MDDLVGTLRVLRRPAWLRAGLLVIALSVACFYLGQWQLHRHEAKSLRNQRIDANYDAAAQPIDQVLSRPSSRLRADQEWLPVRVTGSYLTASTVLIRNRPLDGSYGYEVVVPLRTDAGPVLLVDRGWIPEGRTGSRPDTVSAPPAVELTVLARLRPGEPGLSQTPPPGQQLRIDIARIAAELPTPALSSAVYQAYGVLAQETPAAADTPAMLPRPNEDLGPHLGYAVQWWAFALAGYVLLGVYARREHQTAAAAPRAKPTPRHEPSDEEWEDAATAEAQGGPSTVR